MLARADGQAAARKLNERTRNRMSEKSLPHPPPSRRWDPYRYLSSTETPIQAQERLSTALERWRVHYSPTGSRTQGGWRYGPLCGGCPENLYQDPYPLVFKGGVCPKICGSKLAPKLSRRVFGTFRQCHDRLGMMERRRVSQGARLSRARRAGRCPAAALAEYPRGTPTPKNARGITGSRFSGASRR